IFTGSFNFPIIRMLVLQFSVSAQDFWQAAPDLLILTLDLFIRIAIIYFPLKALEQILRILMEMEFNSRKAT
ncbi:MAG TPA: hypothetical protein VFQ23_14420, partial [Anaerolineales bacterium]|nr:hypothetical protein [Anaerolineales bacterium]